MDKYIINVDLLSANLELLKKEVRKQDEARNKFQNSYLNISSNYILNRMFNNLDLLYSDAQKGYFELYKYFDNYINNVKSLENYLINFNNLGLVNISSVRSIMYQKLHELPDYREN